MSVDSRWNYAVYGKDAPGEVFLLKRCVGEKEAKEIADASWRETHRTAIIVKRRIRDEQGDYHYL